MTLLDRVDIPITEDTISSLINFCDDPYSWAFYAWDIRQKLPPQIARDEMLRWSLLTAGEDNEINAQDIEDVFAAVDRPFNPVIDGLLYNLARDARQRGWKPTPAISVMIDRAVASEEARQAKQRDNDLSAEKTECDHVHAEWLASGAPDELAPDIESWKSHRRTERIADAEAEWDALHAWLVEGDSDSDATDQQIESHELAIANWHRRYDFLFRRKEPMKNLPPPPGLPLLSAQVVIADLGRPIVDAFLAAQSGKTEPDAPTLPTSNSTHPLFESLNLAISHVVASAEHAPKTFRATTVTELLAVLSAVHQSVFDAVCTRIRAAGAALPDSKLTAAVRRFEAQVQREVRTGAGWATDNKGMPDPSNSDNVAVFLRTIDADIRLNAWSNRIEIRWPSNSDWSSLKEKDFNNLLTTAANGQYNFRPRESMIKRAISALASEAAFDPVLDRIAAAQSTWDGLPRLDSWLARACGAPDDAYHRAVGRNLMGGMVKRARRPGCKHDEVVIFIGPEDTLKSTLCRMLALEDEWFTDSVDFSGSPQNTVPQLFGRLVIELSELDGMARREVQFIKRFLSAQTDNVTLKYEAFTSDHARRCIFVGTSNETNPLRGDSGNRRFLPVHIEQRIDVEFVHAHLDQIVGEAAALEAAGETFLIPADVLPDARARQEGARAESDFEIHLNGWFLDKPGATYILPADLATLIKDAIGRSVPSNQYGTAMRRLGFVKMTARVAGVPTGVWCRGGIAGAQRYTVHRSVTDGRLSPKLHMFASVAPPPPPGTAVVLPIRPQ